MLDQVNKRIPEKKPGLGKKIIFFQGNKRRQTSLTAMSKLNNLKYDLRIQASYSHGFESF